MVNNSVVSDVFERVISETKICRCIYAICVPRYSAL